MSVIATSVPVAGASSLGSGSVQGSSARVAEAQQSAQVQTQQQFVTGAQSAVVVVLSSQAINFSSSSRGEAKSPDATKQGENNRSRGSDQKASGGGSQKKLNVVA